MQEPDGRLDPREEGLLVDLLEHGSVPGDVRRALTVAVSVVVQCQSESLHCNSRDAAAVDCAPVIPNHVRMGCLGDLLYDEHFGEELVFGLALVLLFDAMVPP